MRPVQAIRISISALFVLYNSDFDTTDILAYVGGVLSRSMMGLLNESRLMLM
jgi:hypothetical protein